MKQTEAMNIIHNALLGYVEDSAGAGSKEAKTLDKAWDLLKANLPEEDRFPNGFTSWQETHYEIVQAMTGIVSQDVLTGVIAETHEAQGHGGLYELSKAWTDEFELLNVNRQWDGEFFDEVDEFFKRKNTK